MAEEVEFVGEVDKMLKDRERQAQRKTRQLYNKWEAEIYEPIQNQLHHAVNARNTHNISKRNAALMQRFLEVSNAKEPHGVFRDIVIESEYDPMHAHDLTRMTYDPRTAFDPCKLELHRSAPRAGSHSRIPPWDIGSTRPAPGVVPRLSVKMWDKLESTPYGRLGKLVPDPHAKPYALTNNVMRDGFAIERSYDLVSREIPKGKRCFPR